MRPSRDAGHDRSDARGWRQIGCVLAWKLAKGGVTLSEYDRGITALKSDPDDCGAPVGVEWQFSREALH